MTPEHVSTVFRDQGIACGNLGSPFMARICTMFAERAWPTGDVTDRVFAWEGDISPRAQSVPLRLCGGLHALKLKGEPALIAAYPPNTISDDDLWLVIASVLQSQSDFLMRWLDSPPQTNEVRRSATLIPVAHVLTDRFGLPLRLSELGASGGLNLMFDHFSLNLNGTVFGSHAASATLAPEWKGPLPPTATPEIADRAGVDLNPLNPHDAADALRLRAYLWPDQPERAALTDAAITAASADVTQGDAIEWLETRLPAVKGQTHLIYTTIAWQYFPKSSQAIGTTLIEDAGAKATEDAPLAWFGMENDGGTRGAALSLRIWPGNETYDLGRADFHGRWVEWVGL